MIELLSSYNSLIKKERLNYFANLLATKKHNCRDLFQTIDWLVNPATPNVSASSVKDCVTFLTYFAETNKGIKASITPSVSCIPSPDTSPTLLNEFSPISLNTLLDTVSHMYLSSFGLDIVPPRFFKEVLAVTAPCLFSIVNESLTSGLLPDYFKQAYIQPPIKETWPWSNTPS